MKKYNWKKILFLFIVGTAFFLRVYKIDQIPPSLAWDEISIGYNAYSILKTGKDEHGRFFPVDTFIAYGDYKPPVPIYLTVPFIAVFGLSNIAVRLPVAILGTITVMVTFLVVRLLFSIHEKKDTVAFLSMAVLTVSPWHINLSRAGFEAVTALFFIITSILIFLLARERKILFYFAFLPLIVAIYTFNSARYFAPFLGLLILLFLKKYILAAKKEVILGILIAGIALLPIIPHLLSPEARLRFKEVNIFSDVEPVKLANMRAEAAGNTWLAKIIHNRRIYYALAYAKHYLDHFEPSFLFIRGDGNPKFSIQDVGQLYIIEAPLLVIGIVSVLSRYPHVGLFLLAWLGLAIVPAATARETPHALRILNTLPTWQIFIGYGILSLFSFSKIQLVRRVFIGTITFGYIFLITFYLHTYYVHYPAEFSGEWQYGYKQVFEYAESAKDQYKRIVVTDYIGRPYAYALFYGEYSPEEFWNTRNASFDAAGFYNVYGFGKYEFVRTNPLEYEPDTLYILHPESIPPGATKVFSVDLLNGSPALVGFHI